MSRRQYMLLCSSRQKAHCNHWLTSHGRQCFENVFTCSQFTLVTFQHRCKSLHSGFSSAGDNPPTTHIFLVAQLTWAGTNYKLMRQIIVRWQRLTTKKNGHRTTETFNQRSKMHWADRWQKQQNKATTKNGKGKKPNITTSKKEPQVQFWPTTRRPPKKTIPAPEWRSGYQGKHASVANTPTPSTVTATDQAATATTPAATFCASHQIKIVTWLADSRWR